VADWTDDPVVRDFRAQISDADAAILEAVNKRLELVGRLREYKESQGYPFVDRKREAALLEELARTNPGPLSPDGLRQLYACLLGLTKREVSGRTAQTL
jgi:chorismate mutase